MNELTQILRRQKEVGLAIQSELSKHNNHRKRKSSLVFLFEDTDVILTFQLVSQRHLLEDFSIQLEHTQQQMTRTTKQVRQLQKRL